MLKLRRKRKDAEKIDTEQIAVINDCNKILGVIRNSLNANSVSTDEIIIKIGLSEGLPYNNVLRKFRGGEELEERVLKAINELKRRQIIGFGGRLGDSVIFNKDRLPSVIN